MKKELKKLSEKEYKILHGSGLLWEIYPEATGSWETDALLPHLDVKYKKVREKTEKIVAALPKVTLEEAREQIAQYKEKIKSAREKLAEIGKLKSCTKEIWDAICEIKI